MVVNPTKAKQLTATVGKDGATFAFVGPRDVEKGMWSDAITDAFKKVAKKGAQHNA